MFHGKRPGAKNEMKRLLRLENELKMKVASWRVRLFFSGSKYVELSALHDQTLFTMSALLISYYHESERILEY